MAERMGIWATLYHKDKVRVRGGERGGVGWGGGDAMDGRWMDEIRDEIRDEMRDEWDVVVV